MSGNLLKHSCICEEDPLPMSDRVLTREDLFELVWSKPMQHLAKEFGLSDVGLAKICTRYNIPRPERGYWQQLAVGKAPKRPKLRQAAPGEEDIRFTVPPPVPERVASPELLERITRERDPANKIHVPEIVRNYHPLVCATKEALRGQGTRDESLAIRVSDASLPRALRLWHALLLALDERGFQLGKQDYWHRSTVTVLGEEVGLSMDERTKKVKITTPVPGRRWDQVSTGNLRFVIEYLGTRETVKDTEENRLEEQLNVVIVRLVRVALEIARPWRVEQEEQARARAEQQRQQQILRERCDRFQAAFSAWREQQDRLSFLAAIEQAFAKIEAPTEAMREYVAWTRGYVEWADPIGRFFEALRKGGNAQYHHFSPEASRRW
jgi:hypothetical protein